MEGCSCALSYPLPFLFLFLLPSRNALPHARRSEHARGGRGGGTVRPPAGVHWGPSAPAAASSPPLLHSLDDHLRQDGCQHDSHGKRLFAAGRLVPLLLRGGGAGGEAACSVLACVGSCGRIQMQGESPHTCCHLLAGGCVNKQRNLLLNAAAQHACTQHERRVAQPAHPPAAPPGSLAGGTRPSPAARFSPPPRPPPPRAL